FQAEDGIRDFHVTGVQTCALPIYAFLSVGHDEYWSWQMRDNVEHARDVGINLGFFSANTAYWQVRFEDSPTTGQPYTVMVGYKRSEERRVGKEWSGMWGRLRCVMK